METEDGSIPIEDIELGMRVYAYNIESGENELKQVVQLFKNETTELVYVTVEGKEIVCTNEHPFYSPIKGWLEACKLRAGDILVTLNGRYVVVEKVQHEILESPVKVYNFEVEDLHNYYVGDGDDAVLVHNDCGYKAPKGGGGITDTINKNGKNIVFGHGGRHLKKWGLNVNQVNDIIANDVINLPPTQGAVSHGKVNINGINIRYGYFTLPNGNINIGSYYVIDD